MKYPVLLILAVLTLGCSKEEEDPHYEFAGKTFDHLYYETEEECMDAQPDPDFFLNCHQQLDFLDDEHVEIMLTDIIYATTYSIENNQITVYATPHSYEFRENLVFEIINASTLKLVRDNTIWKERQGTSPWQ